MSKVEDFLTAQEEQSIINAIKLAEKNTSGEIRVHIERDCEMNTMGRALEVFYFLKMEETKERNGVLFYFAVDDKKFAILGDVGINSKVPNNFWDTEKEILAMHFINKEFTNGIIKAISEVGLKLKEFFPYQDDDKNELSDEISKS